jgi:hypothetical protein
MISIEKMFIEEQREMTILTRSLFERYLKIADERLALIMACVEGKQEYLVEHLLQREKQDQEILMRETYACLVPRETLYPTTPMIMEKPEPEQQPFELDDFTMSECESVDDEA